MRIGFSLQNVQWNSDAAGVRECTRMLCVAECMRRLGHEVSVPEVQSERLGSRAVLFRRLWADVARYSDTEVRIGPERSGAGVCFKTSVSTKNDHDLLERFKLVVAHQNDPSVNGHPRLLPISFFVGDPVMQQLIEDDLFDAYLDNDMKAIRERYVAPWRRTFGHVGSDASERRLWAQDFCETADRLHLDAKFKWVPVDYDEPGRWTAEEYLRWMGLCRIGIFMRGFNVKGYRWAEWSMLGVPIATLPLETAMTPLATSDNTIQMRDWSDYESLNRGMTHVEKVRTNADAAYREGWSPMGCAKQILARL